MKILIVSMNSIHFVRWTEQLVNSGHEVYWFDILDSGRTEKLPWVKQIVGWKQKYPKLKGRSSIKNRLPSFYKLITPLIENDTNKAFEETLNTIKPDVVHSMALYISCAPILKTMLKYKQIPWIYSSWGSDLFYFKEIPSYLKDIKAVLPRITHLFTDCKRDYTIAKKLGFKGTYLGTFPGGGGFDYLNTNPYINDIADRRTILVKGYQGRSGKAIEVLKAIMQLKNQLKNYKIIVFGADVEVSEFSSQHQLEDKFNISVLSRSKFLPHKEVMKLMGEALIYIGNSNSDGMPNTLLEAISMGAFPIQSNPGGATAEVISHDKNGFLIEDYSDIGNIRDLILRALNNYPLTQKAFHINQTEIKPQFDRQKVTNEVVNQYDFIEKNLS